MMPTGRARKTTACAAMPAAKRMVIVIRAIATVAVVAASQLRVEPAGTAAARWRLIAKEEQRGKPGEEGGKLSRDHHAAQHEEKPRHQRDGGPPSH